MKILNTETLNLGSVFDGPRIVVRRIISTTPRNFHEFLYYDSDITDEILLRIEESYNTYKTSVNTNVPRNFITASQNKFDKIKKRDFNLPGSIITFDYIDKIDEPNLIKIYPKYQIESVLKLLGNAGDILHLTSNDSLMDCYIIIDESKDIEIFSKVELRETNLELLVLLVKLICTANED